MSGTPDSNPPYDPSGSGHKPGGPPPDTPSGDRLVPPCPRRDPRLPKPQVPVGCGSFSDGIPTCPPEPPAGTSAPDSPGPAPARSSIPGGLRSGETAEYLPDDLRGQVCPADVDSPAAETLVLKKSDQGRLAGWFLLGGLISCVAGAILAATASGWTPPAYRAEASLLVPAEQADAWASCVAQLSNQRDVILDLNDRQGRIAMSVRGGDPAEMCARLDALGSSVAERVRATYASMPAVETPAADRLHAELQEVRQQLASAADADAESRAQIGRLQEHLNRWQRLQADRRRLAEGIDAATSRMASTAPAEGAIQISAEEVDLALAADPRYLADRDAVTHQEGQLRGILARNLEAGAASFSELNRQIAVAREQLDAARKGNHGPQVNTRLLAMGEAVTEWERAAEALQAVWNVQSRPPTQPGDWPEAAASQELLARACRTFLDQMLLPQARFKRALDEIGQGEDEVTKRLVLQNALMRQLEPLTKAVDAVMASARALVPAENVELAAVVDRLTALRARLQARRAECGQRLRDQRLAQLRAEHAQAAREAAGRREDLIREAVRQDLEIAATAAETSALLTELQARLNTLKEREILHQQQADIQGRLIELAGRQAAASARAMRPSEVRYVPASAAMIPPPLDRLHRRAAALGLLPAGLYLLACLVVWRVTAVRASRNDMERYARALRAATARSLD